MKAKAYENCEGRIEVRIMENDTVICHLKEDNRMKAVGNNVFTVFNSDDRKELEKGQFVDIDLCYRVRNRETSETAVWSELTEENIMDSFHEEKEESFDKLKELGYLKAFNFVSGQEQLEQLAENRVENYRKVLDRIMANS